MNIIEREIINQIMATDIYLCLASQTLSETEITEDIDKILNQLVDFEQKYSRFITNNLLANLNESESFEASDDLLELIEAGENYYKKTQGLFDPTIYNYLINEGYNVSKKQGFYDRNVIQVSDEHYSFADVKVNYKEKTIKKPKSLHIDFGGIGKGYIVDKIVQWVGKKYENFCIDAGGDMYLGGVDVSNKYPYWAIEIEGNPDKKSDQQTPTLLLSNKAVATSGIGKRTWTKDNATKTHIINPKTKKSVENDLFSVTVVGNTTVYSDIYAKTLLLLGSEDGLEYCSKGNIAAVFLTKYGEVLISKDMEKYVWKDK